jgi:hypothetical protein
MLGHIECCCRYLNDIGGHVAEVVGVGLLLLTNLVFNARIKIGHVDGIYWYVGAIIGQLVVWFVVIWFVAQCAAIVITNDGFPY